MLGVSRTVQHGRTVAFANPEHDSPQRIGYRLSDADRLDAWIEGRDAGQPRRVDFIMRRADCD